MRCRWRSLTAARVHVDMRSEVGTLLLYYRVVIDVVLSTTRLLSVGMLVVDTGKRAVATKVHYQTLIYQC